VAEKPTSYPLRAPPKGKIWHRNTCSASVGLSTQVSCRYPLMQGHGSYLPANLQPQCQKGLSVPSNKPQKNSICFWSVPTHDFISSSYSQDVANMNRGWEWGSQRQESNPQLSRQSGKNSLWSSSKLNFSILKGETKAKRSCFAWWLQHLRRTEVLFVAYELLLAEWLS